MSAIALMVRPTNPKVGLRLSLLEDCVISIGVFLKSELGTDVTCLDRIELGQNKLS